MTLERGTVLHKRYRIAEILGQGGMGSVYRAVDENLGVDVAVKENLFTTDEYARQFRLEATILANLRHPNLPRVSDHFVVGDQGQYLVMDFIEGEDLRQRMERIGNISEDDAVQIGAAICDALMYLHTRRPTILHRDIKPGNVKITPDGHIYLVDFGLAKVVDGGQVTTTGARAMTPGYSPPEQYGTARTDPRTDIYSLGATLYAALCGIIPEDALARAMDNTDLTPLRRRNGRISRRLSAAIEKAMAVDPADRYQTADEFKKALLGSKSQTERLTGRYTVAPPPVELRGPDPDADEAETSAEAINARRPAQPSARPARAEEEKPFIPPGKRIIARNKRRLRGWTTFLLLLAVSLLGYVYLNPGLIPAEARELLPFLPITPTQTSTPAATATLTPVPPSATAVATGLSATATLAPTRTAAPTRTKAATLAPSKQAPTLPAPSAIIPALPLVPTSTARGGGYGQLAFASDRTGIPQLYLLDLSGGNVEQITDIPQGACQPAWSPDGEKLVFVSPCSGPELTIRPPARNTSLFMIDAGGSNLVPLTNAPGGDFEPAWSPDGTHIAFASFRDGSMQIYSMSVADQSVAQLTNASAGIEGRQPSWSASGNEIVFTAKRVGTFQVWAMDASGANLRQIVRSGQDYWDFLPVLSRDGSAVIFSQQRAGASGPAYPVSARYDGSTASAGSRQNFGRLPVEHLSVSPDGFWLAFQGQDEPGNTDIFFLSVTGTERTRLTIDPAQDFDPAWRPLANIAPAASRPAATATP